MGTKKSGINAMSPRPCKNPYERVTISKFTSNAHLVRRQPPTVQSMPKSMMFL